ncbi:uncharacterized protein LOC143631654 [Bidens hawaiensis]|uniref:uncharacterized protein LOC143631654 n=1 Tax=Bidens hawaiensis TaxID=980011 RepID=UPI00404A4FAF
MNANQAQSSSDVVNGVFSINNHSSSVLFDTGADKSFISLDFAYIIDKPWDRLSKPFTVEVANGNSINIDSVIRDCVIVLNKVKFRIDLIPMQMGSFNVIVRMDWLTLNHVEVVCFDKFLHIPFQDGRILKVFGSTPASKLNLKSCFQAQRYLRKKYVVFLALVVEKEKEKRKIQDIPIVRDFPDVFLDDVVGLPPIRQVEFRIDLVPDLVPGANPVDKAPYRLAPSEMQELSSQLQELSDKCFIRPSSSPWSALFYLRRRMIDHFACASTIMNSTSLPSRTVTRSLVSMIFSINFKEPLAS